MMTGSISELLLWLEKYTSDLELELNFYLISMENNTEFQAEPQDMNMLAWKLSDGVFNNLKSKK